MGRSLPPKTIQVLLPPATKASSSSTKEPRDPSSDTAVKEEPPLQVLILAQEIARERGQVFDIASFLSPSQRKEYHRLVHGVDEEVVETPPTPVTGDTEQLETAEGDVPIGDGVPTSAKRAFDEINDESNLPSTSSTPFPTGTPLPEQPLSAVTDVTHPPPTANSDVPTEPIAAKRARLQSMNMHWTQRRKKLQELAKLESEGIKEVPLSPQERPPAPEIGLGLNMAVTAGKGKAPERRAIQASVSYWNHLLTQARKERGPQWDYNTQSYHIDRSTSDYYTHINKPLDSSLPAQKKSASGRGQSTSGPRMTNGYNQAPDVDLQRRMDSQRRSGSISNSTNGYGAPSGLGRPPAFTSAPANHGPSPYQPSPSRGSMSGSVPPQSPHYSQSSQHPHAPSNLPAEYQRRLSQSQHQQPGRPASNDPQSGGQYQFTPQQLAQIAQLGSTGQQGGMNLNPALLQQLAQAQSHNQGQGGQGGINLAQMQQQLARANQMAQAAQSGYPQPSGPAQQGPNAQLQAQFQQYQLAQLAAAQNQAKGPSGMPPNQQGQQMRGVNPAMLANLATMQNQGNGQRPGGVNLAQLGGMGQQNGFGQGANGFQSGAPGQGQNLGGQGQGVMLSGGPGWQG